MKFLQNPSSPSKAVRRTGQWGVFIAIVLAMLSGIGGTVRAQSTTPKRMVIRAGHVLDVRTGQLRANQAIVIEGDKISQIAPSGDVKAGAGDTTIDLPDATLLPGLIDM